MKNKTPLPFDLSGPHQYKVLTQHAPGLAIPNLLRSLEVHVQNKLVLTMFHNTEGSCPLTASTLFYLQDRGLGCVHSSLCWVDVL